YFFFSSRRRHTRSKRDWSSDVCSSDLLDPQDGGLALLDGGKFQAGGAHPLTDGLEVIDGGLQPGVGGNVQRGLAGVLRSSGGLRSEERRVGKEWRGRWATEDEER